MARKLTRKLVLGVCLMVGRGGGYFLRMKPCAGFCVCQNRDFYRINLRNRVSQTYKLILCINYDV